MRPRTAINQAPSGGSIYPFAEDSFLSPLILDFYLVYPDDPCEFVLPFRIVGLTGFGNGVGNSPPLHRYDIQIRDANDTTVFDSTDEPSTCSCSYVEWGDDRIVVEWVKGQTIVRVVAYTDIAEDFEDIYFPILSGGILDPRTYRRIPKHVHAIRVGVTLLQGNVQIKAGYNVELTADITPDTQTVDSAGDILTGVRDGGSLVSVLNLDGVAGAGLGRIEGCEEGDQPVRTINQIKPDGSGNFIIEADDCFRVQLPVVVSEDDSGFRTAEYSSPGLTTDETKAAFKLYDDCTPCCDCHFFSRTYKGLARVWGLWADTTAEAERVRDVYSDNRDRWLAQYLCRVNNPVKLMVLPEPNCRAFEGSTYCNVSKACLRNVEARYTARIYRAGVELVGPYRPEFNVIEAYLDASSTDGEEAYNPLVKLSTLQFFADYVNPQTTLASGARVCYECQTGDVLEVTLTIHAPDPVAPPDLLEPVVLPVIPVPVGLQTAWDDMGVGTGDPVRAMLVKIGVMNQSPPSFDCPC